jgi:hypothetical protein
MTDEAYDPMHYFAIDLLIFDWKIAIESDNSMPQVPLAPQREIIPTIRPMISQR